MLGVDLDGSDGSDLFTLGAPSVQTALDGSRGIVWMIIGMIKEHPTENRMARQAVLGLTSLAHGRHLRRGHVLGRLGLTFGRHDHLIITLLVGGDRQTRDGYALVWRRPG